MGRFAIVRRLPFLIRLSLNSCEPALVRIDSFVIIVGIHFSLAIDAKLALVIRLEL